MAPIDPTCSAARARAWAFLDGALPAEEAEAVGRHLETCPACAAHLEGERAFLGLLGRAGVEPAPPHLRARAATILDSGLESRHARGRRRALPWVAVAAAAAVALLVLALPDGGPGGPALAAAFAADHGAHAESRPSAHPFEAVSPPAPPALAGAELLGISRCIVAGRAYAHYTFAVAGGTVSVFVAIGGAPVPTPGRPAEVEGTTVLAFDPEGGEPGVVLVSDDLGPGALASLRQGA